MNNSMKSEKINEFKVHLEKRQAQVEQLKAQIFYDKKIRGVKVDYDALNQMQKRALSEANRYFKLPKMPKFLAPNGMRGEIHSLNSDVGLMRRKSRSMAPHTKSFPFNFRTDKRAEFRSRIMSSQSLPGSPKIESFKARAMPKYPDRPLSIVPIVNKQPLTTPIDHQLRTASRSIARSEHNDEVEKRTKEREAQLALERSQERREFKHQFENNMFRAQPIKKYRHIDLKQSDKELTNGKSPLLLTKMRSKHRTQYDQENNDVNII